MTETPSHSFGEILSRFIALLNKDPAMAGRTAAEIEAEAVKRAQATMAERRRVPDPRQAELEKARVARRQREAKEWSDEIRSNDPAVHQKAVEEMNRGKYPEGLTYAQAKEHMVQVENVLSVEAPDWLKAGTIHESQQAMELVARISELPPDLQNNPDVLYAELGKFYASCNWRSMTKEARGEARRTMDRVFKHIDEVTKHDPAYRRDILLESIDQGTGFVHLRNVLEEEIEPAGKPSRTKNPHTGKSTIDESSSAYLEWRNLRIREMQQLRLHNMVSAEQDILDSPEFISADSQRKQLDVLKRNLEEGMKRTQKIRDINDTEPPQVNHEDALALIESVKRRMNVLDVVIKNQRDREHAFIITLGELKGKDWFVAKGLSEVTRGKPDSTQFTFGRHWSQEDVDYLFEHGYRKWFYQYIDRVFSMGTERKTPSLEDQYQYGDFKRFLVELYGTSASSVIVGEFQHLWDERSRFDYVVQSLGLGPGDMKRRLEAMSLLQASDLDYLNTFAYANLADTFMERETFGLMADKIDRWEAQGRWLESEVKNDFYDANTAGVVARLRQIYPEKSKEDVERLAKLYGQERIARRQYLTVLSAEKVLQHDSDEFARRGHRKTLETILFASDEHARGVVLEDIDVWGYADLDIHAVHVAEEITRLKNGQKNGTLSEYEREHFAEIIKEFEDREQLLNRKKLAKVYEMDPTYRETEDQAKLIHMLGQYKGLSHIEARVFEEMKKYIGANPDLLKGQKIEDIDIELRMAIWAARVKIMGTGRMAAIGAMLARTPGTEGYGTASGKHVMRAPAFEDLVRTMNVEMFASRFSIGGKMGEVMRHYLRFNLRKDRVGMEKTGKGPQGSFFDTEEWKALSEEITDEKTKTMTAFMRFAERDLGIKFTELLAPGFMGTGGQFDGSAWRLDGGVLDAIRERYLELQKKHPKALLDNQALAIRYLLAENPAARKEVLVKMMRRTPMKFFNLLADQREDLMRKAGLPTDKATWYRFESALKFAETDLWRKKDLIFKDIDLASEADFNKVVRPYLQGVAAADIDKYRELIRQMQVRLTHTGPTRVEYKTYLDGIAQEKLPLTLSLDDFNWDDAEMKALGNLAFPRRTRDIGAMDAAKDIILNFISNKDNILSPNDTKEMMKQLMALKGSVNAYNTTEAAEKVVKQVARMIIEFNRDRSLGALPSWLPGGKAAGLFLAEQDARIDAPYRSPLGRAAVRAVTGVLGVTFGGLARASNKVKPLEKALNWMMPGWEHFSHEPVSHWPHSIGEAISYSVGFTGGHGNHWDERKIDELLNTMHDMGLFTEHHEYLQDLRGEFKAGFQFKALRAVREYWWVIPVATVALASMQSIEEEKKRH